MKCQSVVFSGHAVRRMFQRGLTRQAVMAVVAGGEVIASYPDDRPHPSYLLLGYSDEKPVHVVVAQDATDDSCVIVTAYIPDATLWNNEFRKRRS